MKPQLTKEEIQEEILRALGEIAPEADLARLKPDVNLRDQLDIDSMDLLNFVIALHHALHAEIPDADYPKLMTLSGATDYISLMNVGRKTQEPSRPGKKTRPV